KKGDFYVAVIEKPGRPALDVISEILPDVIKTFPWPKSMRWGVRSKDPGALNWVRPLHSILATFGPETDAPDIVPFTVDGIAGSTARRPPLWGPGPVGRGPARRLCRQVRKGKGGGGLGGGGGNHPNRGEAVCLRAGAWARGGRGVFCENRRSRRMAVGADGRV